MEQIRLLLCWGNPSKAGGRTWPYIWNQVVESTVLEVGSAWTCFLKQLYTCQRKCPGLAKIINKVPWANIPYSPKVNLNNISIYCFLNLLIVPIKKQEELEERTRKQLHNSCKGRILKLDCPVQSVPAWIGKVLKYVRKTTFTKRHWAVDFGLQDRTFWRHPISHCKALVKSGNSIFFGAEWEHLCHHSQKAEQNKYFCWMEVNASGSVWAEWQTEGQRRICPYPANVPN